MPKGCTAATCKISRTSSSVEAATKARRQHLLDTESLYSGPDVGNQGTGDVVLTPQGQSQRCWNVQIARKASGKPETVGVRLYAGCTTKHDVKPLRPGRPLRDERMAQPQDDQSGKVPPQTPGSDRDSLGIRTFHPEQQESNGTEDFSKDVTDVIFESILRDSSVAPGESEDVTKLRAKVSQLETEVSGLQHELSQRQASTVVPGEGEQLSFAATASEEPPLLGAAYQQISVLNTQLAHLYTELTLSRTEAASLRAEKEQAEAGGGANEKLAASEAAVSAAQAENQRQAQQIADLVSDIRHLQLDLEYHQQKVDQLLEEKQVVMKDMKSLQQEVTEARQQLEEKEQVLKHQEVDLMHYRQLEQQSPRGGDDGVLDALRTEAAAKDSALIVSHYELHKEKLMRDRLEQKNLKLMERMQKLMMVVETMRKDNVNLERSLASKDRMYEEKDAQLRIIMQKVRQLQKNTKGKPKGAAKAKAPQPVLELEGSVQNLPPLESSRYSGPASGKQSGHPTQADRERLELASSARRRNVCCSLARPREGPEAGGSR
eukprot:s2456_g10.t2